MDNYIFSFTTIKPTTNKNGIHAPNANMKGLENGGIVSKGNILF